MLRNVVRALALLSATTSASFADDCNNVVVDGAGAISDIQKVEKAIQAVTRSGADVRLRTVKSIGAASNLDEYILQVERTCPSWRSDGKLRSTMLLIFYYPKEGYVAVNYGIVLQPRLSPTFRKILTERFFPQVHASRAGEKDAITRGFVAVLDEFAEVLGRSSAPTGPVTVIRKEATDLSGLWIVLGILVVVATGIAAVFILYRMRSERHEDVSAQREARRLRALCARRVLDITDESSRTLLRAQAEAIPAERRKRFQQMFQQYVQLGNSALDALNRFDPPLDDDPNARELAAEQYEANQAKYAEILARYVEPAERLAKEIATEEAASRNSKTATAVT